MRHASIGKNVNVIFNDLTKLKGEFGVTLKLLCHHFWYMRITLGSLWGHSWHGRVALDLIWRHFGVILESLLTYESDFGVALVDFGVTLGR